MEGAEAERRTAFGAAGLALLADFPPLVPSSAALELREPAEVGASGFAVVGAFGSAFFACDVALVLVACFFVPLPDPVRVAAAFFVPVLLLVDVLAPEAPLEGAVVRRAAGFFGMLVGWSVLMATTVRRVPRAV